MKELLGLGSRYTLLSPSLRTHLTNGFELQGMCYQFAERFAYDHGAFEIKASAGIPNTEDQVSHSRTWSATLSSR